VIYLKGKIEMDKDKVKEVLDISKNYKKEKDK